MVKGIYKLGDQESQRLISRIKEISGITVKPPIELVADTSEFMSIYRGHIILAGGREFFVRGNMLEPRFGMQDQPKFWVKRGYDLESGRMVIIKLEFHEEFIAKIGPLRIPCYRSPHKEGEVLWIVRNDSRFMRGETLMDDVGNHVRVIDYINGKTLYETLFEMNIEHEEYYHTLLAPTLKKVVGCCEAIQMLHNHDLYHGDIRSDHIVIDEETGDYRWIDFDLCQDFEDYDLWRLGNVLQFTIGKGLNPLYGIRKSSKFPKDIVAGLKRSDGGALFSYRLMNLKKIYPYISERLNNVLMHFSAGAKDNYRSVLDLINDVNEAITDIPTN